MHKEMKLSRTDNINSTNCKKPLNNTSFVSSTSSSSISLSQQQEKRLRSFARWYPHNEHLQQEEEYEYKSGKSMCEISTSISLSSSKLHHLSHSPPVKSQSLYSSHNSESESSSSSELLNEKEMESTEDLQRGAEKEWSGLYSGATDLFSLAMLSSMEYEHTTRELTLRFEQCIEQIHCSINYIRRKGLHDALLLLHTAQTQSALESALLASSGAKADKEKMPHQRKSDKFEMNPRRSKSTEITNAEYNDWYNMSAMKSNRRTKMTSTPTLLQPPQLITTAMPLNETEEKIITPFDGMSENILNGNCCSNSNNNVDDNDLTLQSETWRLLQSALCKVDVISVLFEKILQMRIDLRTRMSIAALSTTTTPSLALVTPATTPTASNESTSALSYVGFSSTTSKNYNSSTNNNNNNNSIKLTEDEALLWSSVTHVDPLHLLEQQNEELSSSSESSESEEWEEEEKMVNAEKHVKYNKKESKQTIEQNELHHMDATSPIVELKGNKELVNMFRNMKEMAYLNHNDNNASLLTHKSIKNESKAKEEQDKSIATEHSSNNSNNFKNNVATTTTKTKNESGKEMKDKINNMVHYPPRLPHANLQQSLTRVTFVEQLYALRLLQGFSLAHSHQRYLIGHSCFLWYATELYECFVQHVEAIARINRMQVQQKEMRREYKEKIWVELQQCKRELTYIRRRQQQYQKQKYHHSNELSLTLLEESSSSSFSTSSSNESNEEQHHEIGDEEQPHLPSSLLSSLSSSSYSVLSESEECKTSHSFHQQSASLPASLIRRQRWRNQAQQNPHSTMRSLLYNRDNNNHLMNNPIRNSYYYSNRHKYLFTSQSSREAQRNMNIIDEDGDNNNSARWVSHTRSQCFNVEPIHLRSSSLQNVNSGNIEKREQQQQVDSSNKSKELEAVKKYEKKIKQLEEEMRELEQEEHEKKYNEEDEEEEKDGIRTNEQRHFTVRADQVEIMMALTDAIEALCHYNSYALNKFINSNTLQAMLNVAFCPMVHEPLRLNIFNTISVLLQEMATFRQVNQILVNAPESEFSRTLQKESHSFTEMQKSTNNGNENNEYVEVNYIGGNDYSVLQSMLENANMIEVNSDPYITQTRTIDYNNGKSKRNNNNNNNSNKFQSKSTHFNHKFRDEQSCGFSFDNNVANKFEAAVKEWLITHGLMHLFAALCELHTLREWELLQEVASFSYTATRNTNKKNNRIYNNKNKKPEMSQAELQRQMQRSRYLREHQQRAFLQAVDGKRAEMK